MPCPIKEANYLICLRVHASMHSWVCVCVYACVCACVRVCFTNAPDKCVCMLLKYRIEKDTRKCRNLKTCECLELVAIYLLDPHLVSFVQLYNCTIASLQILANMLSLYYSFNLTVIVDDKRGPKLASISNTCKNDLKQTRLSDILS